MANPSTGTVRRGLASVSDGKPRNTNKKACGAAFFDVDGTLIDIYTSPLHADCANGSSFSPALTAQQVLLHS